MSVPSEELYCWKHQHSIAIVYILWEAASPQQPTQPGSVLHGLEKNRYTFMIPTRRSVLSERETPSGLPYVGLYSRSLLLESVKSLRKTVHLLLSWKINPGKGPSLYFMYNPCGQGAQGVEKTLWSKIILSLTKVAWLSQTGGGDVWISKWHPAVRAEFYSQQIKKCASVCHCNSLPLRQSLKLKRNSWK